MRYTLTWPDGREEVLLDVPKYDFNWQLYYELEKPKGMGAPCTCPTAGAEPGKVE